MIARIKACVEMELLGPWAESGWRSQVGLVRDFKAY